jgi:CheY-like chemotaxis protein
VPWNFVKQTLQILVVDDEAIVRRSIKMLLEHDGHKVWHAGCGEAALVEVAQRKFDLVITDFSMPGMHGDQLVTRIRQLIPTQSIIMITAFVEEYKVFGEVSGRVDVLLLKPFAFQELRDAIEQVLIQAQPDQTTDVPPVIKPPSEPDFLPRSEE